MIQMMMNQKVDWMHKNIVINIYNKNYIYIFTVLTFKRPTKTPKIL